MKKQSMKQKFLFIQSLYAKVTLIIFILSSTLVLLGYAFVKAIIEAPQTITSLAVILFYYHLAHFIFGLLIIISYFIVIRRRIGKVRLMKVILSIFLTPVSFLLTYIAVFLLVVSSCST